MPHQTRDVRCFADCWVPHNVEVSETGEAERFANSVASRLLNVAEDFCFIGEANACEQSQNAGNGVLRLGRQAVLSLVGRVKRGMPLRDEVCLAGKPDAVRLG